MTDMGRQQRTTEESRQSSLSLTPGLPSCLGPALLRIEGVAKVTVFTPENPIEQNLWECRVCMSEGTGTSLDGFL